MISLSPASCKVSLEFLTTNLAWSSRKDMKLLKNACIENLQLLKDCNLILVEDSQRNFGLPISSVSSIRSLVKESLARLQRLWFSLVLNVPAPVPPTWLLRGAGKVEISTNSCLRTIIVRTRPQTLKHSSGTLVASARCDSTDFDGYRATPSSSSSGTNSALLQDLGVQGLNLKSIWKIELWWNK